MMNILLDNSTYYSFKVAVQDKLLDAQILYNMANFLECLVMADKIYLAPTIYWKPDATDCMLFEPKGPCVQLAEVGPDDATISQIWQTAISESMGDLLRPVIRNMVPLAGVDLGKTYAMLKNWEASAKQDPCSFKKAYSGLVYLTDAGTSHFFTKTFGTYMRSIPPYHHLANYLLRTNVARQMSYDKVYQPHSYRAPLVCDKIARDARNAKTLVLKLVRATELEIGKKISDLARALRSYGGYSLAERNMPLVLAVVLSSVSKPDDIVQHALKLRRKRAARRYRKWSSELVRAIEVGNPVEQKEAIAQLQEAREVLSTELSKLYEVRKGKALGRFSKFVSCADPGELAAVLAGGDPKADLVKEVARLAKEMPAQLNLLRQFHLRHNLTLLISFAKQSQKIKELNLLLGRVFGKNLPPSELLAFEELRADRDELIGRIRVQRGF